MHERKQVTLKVLDEEFKGYIDQDTIQWFHPQPKQKLGKDYVQQIEEEIQNKIDAKEL